MNKKITQADVSIKAVVVLSGGQDSATCLALACRQFGPSHVAAITFTYGQRHALEVKYARHLAEDIFTIGTWLQVPLDFYESITENALMNPDQKITRAAGAKCPNTVVEGRNALFLQIAAVWAKRLGATEIYTGVSEADFSGYPDCREVFIKAQQRSIRLALDYPIKIVTPFMKMSKADEWALADKLGIIDIIKNETVTCYNGVPGAGCGHCPACRLRNRGLHAYERQKKASAKRPKS